MENAKINYGALKQARGVDLQKSLSQRLKRKIDRGKGERAGTLRHTVLQKVVGGNYDLAKEELELYVETQSKYPLFEIRSERYIQHCLDLMNAIRAKRNFPGLTSLSRSHQQELTDKVIDHFDELKEYLRKIEIIEKELKLEDLRSTVFTVKVFFYCLFIVFGVAFFNDLASGLGRTFSVVFNDVVSGLIQWAESFL